MPMNKSFLELSGGLFCRHVSLTSKFIQTPNLWTGELGAIILRSICENYITQAWIQKDKTQERCAKFINYGLGQMKLHLERTKEEFSKLENVSNEQQQYLEFQEYMINRERYEFLLDVNVGDWSGIGVRQMAIEAGCKDFYDFVYSPFSESTHGTWNHLIKYNLTEEGDPLAMNIKKPRILVTPPDFHYVELAIKYMDKFIRLIQNHKIETGYQKTPGEIFYEELEKL
jgi:hypothetical protein